MKKKKKKALLIVLGIFTILSGVITVSAAALGCGSLTGQTFFKAKEGTLAKFNTNAKAQSEEGPDVSAEAYCVIDADSGEIVLEKNAKDSMAPASITKMLTALITAEQCKDLDDTVIFSKTAACDVPILSSSLSPAGRVGERMTVRDALYGMMLKSANECANVLAEYISGSKEAFAGLMNERLKELGCKNTNFETPSGLDSENHKTTAYDMCLILKAAMNNEAVKKVMSAKEYAIPETNTSQARTVTMGHEFVSGKQECEGVIAGKTGYTIKAGWTLATAVMRDEKTLLIVTLKSGEGQNYQDNKSLIDYAFALVQNREENAPVTVYSPQVSDRTSEGFTVSFQTGNKASRVEFPVWADSTGHSDLTREVKTVTPDTDQVSIEVKKSDHNGRMGVYTVQAYAYDDNGNQAISTVKVLMTDEDVSEGVSAYNGNYYYNKENGALGLNWIETEDGCYYADYETGVLQTGLQNINGVQYDMDDEGRLQTGFQEINGKTYYFQASGDGAVGWMRIDEQLYYFNPAGQLETNFLE